MKIRTVQTWNIHHESLSWEIICVCAATYVWISSISEHGITSIQNCASNVLSEGWYHMVYPSVSS